MMMIERTRTMSLIITYVILDHIIDNKREIERIHKDILLLLFLAKHARYIKSDSLFCASFFFFFASFL